VVEIGYGLSCNEHTPNALIRYARLAEKAGFTFALFADAMHPWVQHQGHSPFVWSILGAITQTTRRLRLGLGVTCSTMRLHPVIIAQAAATVATMMPGRFFLSVDTGETLHEYLLGQAYATTDLRLKMLEEAVQVMRLL
jgi:G6PDH family F420-dependent oxidoreductase